MWGLLHKDLKTISLQGRVLAIMAQREGKSDLLDKGKKK